MARVQRKRYSEAFKLEAVRLVQTSERIGLTRWPTRWPTRRLAERDVAAYIERFYNPVRLHSTLGYQSPALFEAAGVR